ncbi:hypothetical protein QUB05_05655 [Microcoleus sp. F10-C6]|uniref:hypothetical protein n=1 Tax=unclassified Microcoleus TaxID=2642155 RepID=UPI002FCFA1F7
MHYTLEELKQKSLTELKEIGHQLSVFPDSDRRYRQNWIDAIAGTQPPLLQLLEASPVEVEPVQEAIEVQATEPIEVQRQETRFNLDICWVVDAEDRFVGFLPVPADEYLSGRRSFAARPGDRVVEPGSVIIKPIEVQATEPIETPPGVESKFGRIVYPKVTVKPIAQNAETRPELARTESADVCNGRSHPAESVRDSNSAETEALGSEKGDRVLAVAGNHQAGRGGVLLHQPTELAAFNDEKPPNRGDGKGRLESEPRMSQSAIAQAAENSPGVKVDRNPILTGIALSDRFLATYPPYFGEIHYKAEADTGQLNLLEPDIADEPPDPDDFESLDAFREAMACWDAENPEPLTVSMDSMCEWAPCSDDWYEPEAGIMPIKASSMRESSSTLEFSIPTFDAWCDRANRQNDRDEPPDTGNFARLPGPKPPKFPPRAIGSADTAKKCLNANRHTTSTTIAAQTPITCTVAAGSSRLGRDPPGGDAM